MVILYCAQFCAHEKWETMDSLDTMELMDSMEQVEKQQKKGNQPLFKDLRNFDVSLFHAGNRGSNPLGDASKFKGLQLL
jgi:hypothetical protein